MEQEEFEEVCYRLIEAEINISIENERKNKKLDSEIDLEIENIIEEGAGFRRAEKWGFIFKHFREERVTPDLLKELESKLDNAQIQLDIICLVTSGDITSIGQAIAVRHPKIRIWDRTVLNGLVYKHLNSVGKYFKWYEIALESISKEIEKISSKKYLEFENKLKTCPSGKKYFAQYERVCKEILEYLFEGQLKPFDNQNETSDETQRRDIIFRNLRKSEFFERIFARFNADFIIFDPKNYRNEIEKQEFESISKYPNKAIGNFAVLISREGETEVAKNTQARIFRDSDKIILSISDSNLLEMISRKERGENPEDLLSDLLDNFLLSY